MLSDLTKTIEYKVRLLPAEKQEEVLRFINELQPRRSLLEMAQEAMKDVPQEEIEKIPTDASINLDHYLYGSPKK